jgi:hypothetical protein
MRPCTIELSRYKSSLEGRHTPHGTNIRKQIFPLNLHWTELQFPDFCCDNGSPDGRDVQAGLTDRMVYQRHVGGFLVFPVGGVWFSLQDFASFQHILRPSYAFGVIMIFQADSVSGYICAP